MESADKLNIIITSAPVRIWIPGLEGASNFSLQASFLPFFVPSNRHSALNLVCGSAQRLRVLTRVDMRL